MKGSEEITGGSLKENKKELVRISNQYRHTEQETKCKYEEGMCCSGAERKPDTLPVRS